MWIRIIVGLLAGYLLGNINGAVCVSNLMHDDVRAHGSGNAGLTNFIRNYGNRRAFYVVVIDAVKAIVSCLLMGLLMAGENEVISREGAIIGGLAVMVGHVFPVLLGFRGGKGILSGLFVTLVVDWRISLLILAVFFTVYFITHYVSLGSVLSALVFSAGFCVLHGYSPVIVACAIVMSALTIFMHRSNIVRLVTGKEVKTELFVRNKKV